jgi:hypothetical protein
LSLGLIIFFAVLAALGIIANIILCIICCKPGEIFAQQRV